MVDKDVGKLWLLHLGHKGCQVVDLIRKLVDERKRRYTLPASILPPSGFSLRRGDATAEVLNSFDIDPKTFQDDGSTQG